MKSDRAYSKTIFKIILPVFILLAMTVNAFSQSISHTIPTRINRNARYLFYLHGRIIELQGIRPTSPKYGVYEYQEILNTFRKRGFYVISEARMRNTITSQYARKVVSQVSILLQKGVRPSNITVVGASKGALIAMQVSSMMQNKDLNFVFIAGCSDLVLSKYDVDFWGNILTIYDEADEVAGSCEKFIQRSTGVNKQKEIKLTVGTGHGVFFRPIREWVEPTVQWAKFRR